MTYLQRRLILFSEKKNERSLAGILYNYIIVLAYWICFENLNPLVDASLQWGETESEFYQFLEFHNLCAHLFKLMDSTSSGSGS